MRPTRAGSRRHLIHVSVQMLQGGFAYSAYMAHRTSAEISDYDNLHATTVDALAWYVRSEKLDEAAHEVLSQLRDNGLSIPLPSS